MITWSNGLHGVGNHYRGVIQRGPSIGVLVELREGDEIWGVFRAIHQTGEFEMVESFPKDGVALDKAKEKAEELFSATH